MEGGYCDPIRLFVKDEPHSMRKVNEGRMRLIFSVGLVDQCVERFFAQKQNKVEKSMWFELPSLIGMGFDQPHVSAMLSHWFTQDTVIESDVSGWDWTVQECELRGACALRESLIVDCPEPLRTLMRARYHCILHKMLSMSNGETVIGPVGIMPSGSYLTSVDNSHMRATLGLRARFNCGTPIENSMIKCVGDDCVEEDDTDLALLREEYQRLGHKIKDIRVSSSDDFELCSHRFTKGTPVPLTVPKSVYKWAQGCRGLDETISLIGFCENLDHLNKQKVLEVISRFGGDRENNSNGETTTTSTHSGELNESPEGTCSD